MLRISGKIAVLAALWACPGAAGELLLTPDLAEVRLSLRGQEAVIARAQEGPGLECPPGCIVPIQAAKGEDTLGPIKAIGFMQAELVAKIGLLLDVQMPARFAAGHVPGPKSAAENPYQRDILLALGARDAGEVRESDTSPALAIYAAGPSQNDAVRAVQALAAAGYPAQKLRFFRGGMQERLQLGLTLSVPAQKGRGLARGTAEQGDGA